MNPDDMVPSLRSPQGYTLNGALPLSRDAGHTLQGQAKVRFKLARNRSERR